MPGIGGRFGWNEPPPAAITTTLQAIVVCRRRCATPEAARRCARAPSTISPKWNSGANGCDLLDQLVDQPCAEIFGQPGMS